MNQGVEINREKETTLTGGRKKLLFLVTEDWYFCSHRLPPARAAKEAGYEVVVATHIEKKSAEIQAEGFRVVPIGLRRGSRNPIRELAAIIELVFLYKRERPDVVHHVAIKPVLYGSFAALIVGRIGIVNALAGLGFLYTSSGRLVGFVRRVVSHFFRVILNFRHSVLILQNPDDVTMFISKGLIEPSRIRLIRGSGVDINRFYSMKEPDGAPVVLLASRMLWNKGVKEFFAAAKFLRDRGSTARFVLVGDGDVDNPESISDEQLKTWNESGGVEWWGRCEDMPAVFMKSSIVCLPSYREGVPKVLLEAAACAKVIIATDVPGCREIVLNRETGLLVPVRDSKGLAEAIELLLNNPSMRVKMGQKGRELVEQSFSESIVAESTLNIYREFDA